jgi:hypothetical protein
MDAFPMALDFGLTPLQRPVSYLKDGSEIVHGCTPLADQTPNETIPGIWQDFSQERLDFRQLILIARRLALWSALLIVILLDAR